MTPLPGANAGNEVFVQGKHLKIVMDLLMEQGVPKKWIDSRDLTTKKKK